MKKKKVPGILLAPAPTYFRLITEAQKNNDWNLHRELIEGGVSTFISSSHRQNMLVFRQLLVHIEATKSFVGVESLFLSGLNSAKRTGNTKLVNISLPLLKRIPIVENPAKSKVPF